MRVIKSPERSRRGYNLKQMVSFTENIFQQTPEGIEEVVTYIMGSSEFQAKEVASVRAFR